jgi:hypothetical protein
MCGETSPQQLAGPKQLHLINRCSNTLDTHQKKQCTLLMHKHTVTSRQCGTPNTCQAAQASLVCFTSLHLSWHSKRTSVQCVAMCICHHTFCPSCSSMHQWHTQNKHGRVGAYTPIKGGANATAQKGLLPAKDHSEGTAQMSKKHQAAPACVVTIAVHLFELLASSSCLSV